MASQPDKWDYTLAGVPSPLTDELESQQLAKQVICCSIHLYDDVLPIIVSWVTCCSIWLYYLQSAWSLAATFLCAVCGQPHLCMYLQVAFACPAAHAVVLLAVNCIIACI